MRVALVTPRYGREVNGGAETLAREYATRLASRMDVNVLTTCALDYRTWADHFPPGRSTEDDVTLLRFPVPAPRDGPAFDALGGPVLEGLASEEAWMDAQGPVCPGLLEHLRTEGTSYDAVIFIPYLYWTTVRGLPLVADRAVLVPAMHDEPWLRLRIFDPVVSSARALVFSTPEERELAGRRFGVDPERCHLVGAGIDPVTDADAERFRGRHGLTRPYLVCVGRIDPSKGSDELLRHHAALRRRRPDGPDLVMLGRSVMDLPGEPWLVTPGFVSDEDKHDAIAGATALVAPSPYESLSLVLLEAWSHGIPTISSARSEVLVGQSRRAGAGLWYRDADEFEAAVELIERRPALARALGRAGWRLVRELSWPAVVDRLEEAILAAAGKRPAVVSATTDAPSADRPPVTVPAEAPDRAGALLVAAPATIAPLVAAAIRRSGRDAVLHVVQPGHDAGARAAADVVVGGDPATLDAMDVIVDDGTLGAPSREGRCLVLPATEEEALALRLRKPAAATSDRGLPT